MRRPSWLFRVAYDFLFHLLLPVLSIIQGWALLRGGKKAWQILGQRLALYHGCKHEKPLIWFHGASLGEVLTLLPLMEKLRSQYDHVQVLSVTTVRGEYIAKQKSEAEHVIFLPLDISYIVRRSLRIFQPKLIVIVETEIWPNFFWQSALLDIPLVVVSGRISQRSFPRYYWLRWFFRQVLCCGNFLMQSELDRERICKIGAPSEKISVCGDIKYDGLRTELTDEDKQWLTKIFPVPGRTIVIGSTHPGEEKIVLGAFAQIAREFDDIFCILAPRHLERIEEVVATVEESGLDFCRRSQFPRTPHPQVTILDTYGELSRVYGLADIVFIGGTLVPVGGHNIMEPAALGKAVVYGPHIFNFPKQARSLRENEASWQLAGKDELVIAFRELLRYPEKAKAMGSKGRKAVLDNRGAMEKCLGSILVLLERKS